MTRPANFATVNFTKLANLAMVLRSWQWCCEVGNGLRNAQYPAATVPLLTVPAASHPVFNCISFSSLFLGFLIESWVV